MSPVLDFADVECGDLAAEAVGKITGGSAISRTQVEHGASGAEVIRHPVRHLFDSAPGGGRDRFVHLGVDTGVEYGGVEAIDPSGGTTKNSIRPADSERSLSELDIQSLSSGCMRQPRRNVHWAPARLRVTTPPMIMRMPRVLAAVSGSFSATIPMTAMAAVPTPHQIAYATLTCRCPLRA